MPNNTTIQVRLIIDSVHALSHTKGDKLFDALVSACKDYSHIDLDFSGIETATSGFCNHSIGRFFAECADADNIINFSNTTPIIQKKIENAIHLAKNPQESECIIQAFDYVIEHNL